MCSSGPDTTVFHYAGAAQEGGPINTAMLALQRKNGETEGRRERLQGKVPNTLGGCHWGPYTEQHKCAQRRQVAGPRPTARRADHVGGDLEFSLRLVLSFCTVPEDSMKITRVPESNST